MWFELRAAELDFRDSARRRWVVKERLNAPRAAVWDAFFDPGTGCHCFPDFLEASYPGSTCPHGVGTRRFSHLGRQYHQENHQETMLAWDEGIRWAPSQASR